MGASMAPNGESPKGEPLDPVTTFRDRVRQALRGEPKTASEVVRLAVDLYWTMEEAEMVQRELARLVRAREATVFGVHYALPTVQCPREG